MLRSNNGSEFVLNSFYASKGIIHQLSCMETSQQNSVVERKHQHLLAVARALRFQANLPLKFWGDCVLTATYLINRIPSLILHDLTPFQILLGKPPSYIHLKSFGCLCYASTLARDKSKFDHRTKACIFLGYPLGTKGYKLFDLASRTCFFSRDVVFKESYFPFKHWTSKSNPIPSLTPSDSVFPSQYVLPESHSSLVSAESFTLPVSVEFTPAFTTDIATPLDEFPDIVSPPSTLKQPHFDPTLPVLPTSVSPHLPQPQRKSSRPHKASSYLLDYHCNLASSHVLASTSLTHPLDSSASAHSGILYPISSILTYDKLSTCHRAFAISLSISKEPDSYAEAILDPRWQEAMQAEFDALKANNTWVMCPLPLRKVPIGCKWVYKVKLKADGFVERFKAHLVAKGFTQTEGIDFFETFSLVVKFVTVRTLLALTTISSWHLTQLDVNNAFLHGDLHEEVYVHPPPGFGSKGEVCKLLKSLYGLKQASKQ